MRTVVGTYSTVERAVTWNDLHDLPTYWTAATASIYVVVGAMVMTGAAVYGVLRGARVHAAQGVPADARTAEQSRLAQGDPVVTMFRGIAGVMGVGFAALFAGWSFSYTAYEVHVRNVLVDRVVAHVQDTQDLEALGPVTTQFPLGDGPGEVTGVDFTAVADGELVDVHAEILPRGARAAGGGPMPEDIEWLWVEMSPAGSVS